MKKPAINFVIDVLMFVCMSAIIGIGFLIKYTLIPGQERWAKYGENLEFYFWGTDRHEWGSIHLIIGFVLLGLLVLHIILHWNFIVCRCDRFFKKRSVKRIVIYSFFAICSLFVFIPLFIKPEISKIEQGAGRQVISSKKNTENIVLGEKEAQNKNAAVINSEDSGLVADIRGYMSLNEISEKYNVPAEYIKKELKLPEAVSNGQRLSLLRKKYNIRMDEIERIIKEYKKKQNK